MALPRGTTGSLCPTFVSARLVCLAVRQAYAIALNERFPTALSLPSSASATLCEATAPVKLPTMHCPGPRCRDAVRYPYPLGWYFTFRSHHRERRRLEAYQLFYPISHESPRKAYVR